MSTLKTRLRRHSNAKQVTPKVLLWAASLSSRMTMIPFAYKRSLQATVDAVTSVAKFAQSTLWTYFVCVRDNTVSRSQLLSACFSVWSCSTVSLHTQHCMPRLPLSTELLVWAHSSRVALCDATEHTHRERHDVMLQSTLIASGIGICYRAFSNRE